MSQMSTARTPPYGDLRASSQKDPRALTRVQKKTIGVSLVIQTGARRCSLERQNASLQSLKKSEQPLDRFLGLGSYQREADSVHR